MEYIIISLLLLIVGLLAVILFRKPNNELHKLFVGAISDCQLSLKTLSNDIAKIDQSLRQETSINREEMRKTLTENREEQSKTLSDLRQTIDVKLHSAREETQKTLRESREEQSKSFYAFENTLKTAITQLSEQQGLQSEKLTNKLDEKLKTLQEENSKKLEEMRQTVDEKLQATVEKRFNESFTLISERLEQVHKGLGEMQTLAVGVGDLKKVFSNVKTRGVLGEMQLSLVLEEILPSEFYIKNAQVKTGSNERVEYAIKMPSRNIDDQPLLLPIDSKFPIEDYQRLIDGIDNSSTQDELKNLNKSFENSIKQNAKTIREKYINPPMTTDFAFMFVPTESLYSEIIKRDELFYTLQNDYKITVVGPSNLVAILNALSWGFKTLAIEKRSSEVWEVLGAVKTQFGNFGDILAKTKKKLEETTNVIETAERKSRTIERKLKGVQEVTIDKSNELLGEIEEY